MTEKSPDKSHKESLLSLTISLGLLFILVFAFKNSVLDANNIPSGSMIPTLKIGDYLFVNKMRYSFRIPYTNIELFRYDDPQRGDIITFIPPPPARPEKHYVKRVIGIPGDLVRIRNIPVCQLESYLNMIKENEDANLSDSQGQETPETKEVVRKSYIKESTDRDYSCTSLFEEHTAYQEPVIALVEYKPGGKGDWQTFPMEEMSGKMAIKVLSDSDNERVLHPDLFPPGIPRYTLPVLFRVKTGGREHEIVEKANTTEPYALCPNISTSGCEIPYDYYLVMGDNRDDSSDSRLIGLIKRHSILGKAVIIYFSINWHDQICRDYIQSIHQVDMADRGFLLDDFPPESQYRYCSDMDRNEGTEGIFAYLMRTVLYRIPRMTVRWDRIGVILK